jgi:hypothetical protein
MVVIAAVITYMAGGYWNESVTLFGQFVNGISVQENTNAITVNDTEMVIDFSSCTYSRWVHKEGIVSTIYMTRYVQNDTCYFYYGTVRHTNKYHSGIQYRCLVPTAMGKKNFVRNGSSVNLAEIYSYCSVFSI